MGRNYTTCRPSCSCSCNTNCSYNSTSIDASSVDYITCLQQRIPDCNDVATTRLPYDVVTLLVSQDGVLSPPTIIELENTTGATITTTWEATGVYHIVFSDSVLTTDKVAILSDLPGFTSINDMTVIRLNQTIIAVYTFKTDIASDSIMSNATIEIRIYP